MSFLTHYGMCHPDADVRYLYSEQESSEGKSEVESSTTTTLDSAASGQHVKVPLQLGVYDISMKNYRKPINRYFNRKIIDIGKCIKFGLINT